jgi:hypothetical protein
MSFDFARVYKAGVPVVGAVWLVVELYLRCPARFDRVLNLSASNAVVRPLTTQSYHSAGAESFAAASLR